MKRIDLLLISSVLVLGFLLFGIAEFLHKQAQTSMYALEEKDLMGQADTISGFLQIFDLSSKVQTQTQAQTIEYLNPYIAQIGDNATFRITVVDIDGTVLADSWLSTEQVIALDNHNDRPEISSATIKEPGVSIRYSSTVNADLIYVARTYYAEKFSGTIRVATPLSIVNDSLSTLHSELLFLVFILCIAVCLTAFFLHQYLDRTTELYAQRAISLRHRDEQAENIKLIQRFGQMLATCETHDELFKVVEKMGTSIFGESSMGALAISHPSLNSVKIMATWGGEWPGEKRYNPKDCWGFRRGGIHLSNLDPAEMSCTHIDEGNTIQCIPLQSQGVSLGALHICAMDQDFTETSFSNKVLSVSEHLTLGLANIKLREKLEQQAIRDPLTFLYNRRYLDESFAQELTRAKRKEISLAVVMIDVDHFKAFNDNFGHDAGDHVIKEFSKLLATFVRNEDICCRYGGEEFLLILNEITIEDSQKRMTELLQQIRELSLDYHNISLGKITVSMGISIYPDHGVDQQTLIKKADEAMYQAKNAGRDQLQLAEFEELEDESSTIETEGS